MPWSSRYGPILQMELKQQDIIHQVKGSQEETPTSFSNMLLFSDD